MKTKENSRMFSRHLVDGRQSPLHASFWCSGNEREHKTSLKELHEKIIDSAFIFNTKRFIEDKIPVSLKKILNSIHPVITGYLTQLLNSDKYYTLFFGPADYKLNKFFLGDSDRLQVVCQQNVGVYRFVSVVLTQTQSKVVVKLPKSIMRSGKRDAPRYVSSPDNPLRMEINSRLLKGKSLQCKVTDLTLEVFSIVMVYPNDLFVEGMYSQITLIIPPKHRINTAGEVRHIGMVMEEQAGNHLRCRFHFVNLSESDSNYRTFSLLRKKYPDF